MARDIYRPDPKRQLPEREARGNVAKLTSTYTEETVEEEIRPDPEPRCYGY